MRLGIIILFVAVFFSCKEEESVPCMLAIQSNEEAKEFLLGLWTGLGRVYNFIGRGEIEEYIPNHSIVYNSEFEMISKNEILVTRDFPWMVDSVTWVVELGFFPDTWSPRFEDYKEPTLHKITFFDCDSMMIENFRPKRMETTPDKLVWNDVRFSRVNR